MPYNNNNNIMSNVMNNYSHAEEKFNSRLIPTRFLPTDGRFLSNSENVV